VKSVPFARVWDKKSLIFHFSVNSIKLRYRGAYLGVLWAALEPLFMFLLLYVVFSSIREINKENFAVYLITGIMLYHLFIKGTLAGLSSLRDNGSILKSLNVQKEFFPIVATGSTTLLMFVTLGVFFGLMPVFQFIPPLTILLLPIVLVLLLLLILGISYVLSIINVYLRDIQPLWAIFSYALIFVTPIFWYLEDVEGILVDIHGINPLGQIIELGHKIIFGNIPTLNEWGYTIAIVLGIFFGGYAIFQKFETKISEKL